MLLKQVIRGPRRPRSWLQPHDRLAVMLGAFD